ncbi:NTP transferase domain-containing protein, partial [Rhodobacter capsulatus]
MAIALIVLAAGQGTRMNSDLPKVLHRLAGAPLLAHALAAGRRLDPERVVVVVGHGADLVEKAARKIEPEAEIALQAEQLGTGHAVAQALLQLATFEGKVVVLYGDTPFIAPETLERLVE